MSLENESMLALGNTASVMATIAKALKSLYVAYPTNVSSVVLQVNEKCFPASRLDFPLSISCYRFLKEMSSKFSLFHAELGYAVACNAAGVPYGVHIHGVTDIDLLFPRTRAGIFLKKRYVDALMNARYVVCHPAAVTRIRALRADAVSLPLPVDTMQFNERVAPAHFGEGTSIFSPSRMDRWKGHEIIWEAIRIMRNREKVTVYQSDWGWEPEYSLFKKQAPKNVQFIPLVPRERIAGRYRGATLVIGQMKNGRFGMTEVEASACGSPVLAYLSNENAPFMPKKNDAKTLADAIDKLLEDAALRRVYARSCADYLRPQVSLEAVTGKFLAALNSGDMSDRRERGAITDLYTGTCLEVVGRALGHRLFPLLKSSLIGL